MQTSLKLALLIVAGFAVAWRDDCLPEKDGCFGKSAGERKLEASRLSSADGCITGIGRTVLSFLAQPATATNMVEACVSSTQYALFMDQEQWQSTADWMVANNGAADCQGCAEMRLSEWSK